MKEESKPSILLSLPPELWHLVMKAVRECGAWDGGIVLGPKQQIRQILLRAASAHRILRPYAQEELLRIVSITSQEQLITLVQLLKGSSRLEGYAKRTESIELFLEDEGGLNDLLTTLFEMCCNTKSLYFEQMDMRLSTIARLTNLRDLFALEISINIDQPTAPLAGLTRLHFYGTQFVDGNGNDCDLDLIRSLFSPAQFPAFREMHIDDVALGEDPTRFNLLLPQLSDVDLSDIPLSLVATQLPHCTSLTKLRLSVDSTEDPTHLLPFFNSLRELHLEEFHYWDSREADGEISLRDVRSIMAIVGERKTLKKLSLALVNTNNHSDVGKEWRAFKEEVRKICQKNKVQMMRFQDDDEIFERHELTWVD